jgi:hypothetical protein
VACDQARAPCAVGTSSFVQVVSNGRSVGALDAAGRGKSHQARLSGCWVRVLLVDYTGLRRVSPRAAQRPVRIREVTGSIEPV